MSQHLLPVIRSEHEFKIPWKTLRGIIAGASIIDIDELHTTSIDRAVSFIKHYGVDPETVEGKSALSLIRSLAIEYLHRFILVNDEKSEFNQTVGDKTLPDLMVVAPNWRNKHRTNRCCIWLKLAHAMPRALRTHGSEAEAVAVKIIEKRLKVCDGVL